MEARLFVRKLFETAPVKGNLKTIVKSSFRRCTVSKERFLALQALNKVKKTGKPVINSTLRLGFLKINMFVHNLSLRNISGAILPAEPNYSEVLLAPAQVRASAEYSRQQDSRRGTFCEQTVFKFSFCIVTLARSSSTCCHHCHFGVCSVH